MYQRQGRYGRDEDRRQGNDYRNRMDRNAYPRYSEQDEDNWSASPEYRSPRGSQFGDYERPQDSSYSGQYWDQYGNADRQQGWYEPQRGRGNRNDFRGMGRHYSGGDFRVGRSYDDDRGGDFYGSHPGRYSQGYQSGTQSGFRGRGPKNFQRSDDRICEDVCQALSDHDELDASNIEVDVENGVVTLGGSTEDRRARRLAEEVVESVWGVEDVNNEIRVQTKGQSRGQNKGENTEESRTESSESKGANQTEGGKSKKAA